VTNVSTALAALGDPTRRAIFERVAERPAAVGEIALAVPVSRPAVSQHLKILKEAGLVADRQAGTRRIYRIEPQGIGELRVYFEGFWSQALDAFRLAAQEPDRPTRRSDPSTMNQTDQEEA
jgi:DNA-binding transcriptional ArsR family regulator